MLINIYYGSILVQSTWNAANDKDPSSNTDGATQSTCRHSVSIGGTIIVTRECLHVCNHCWASLKRCG